MLGCQWLPFCWQPPIVGRPLPPACQPVCLPNSPAQLHPAGKRCKICAKLDQERLETVTTEERAAVAELKRVHICEVMNDREVSIRGNRVAEADALAMKPDGFGQILKITIDGMDQAKFRCPRNLASSAEFEACWRPQLHVVGAIIHGHMECYFLMNADQPKDSNMNATVICRCLDILCDKLGPQFSLPRTLIVAADNTTRESKNQHFANFLSYLVATEKFECVEQQFMQTGHTHNEQDQRFSSVTTLLSRAPVLEDATDFADWIRNIAPPRNRSLHVEVLDTTYDFSAWFSALQIQLSGLAATHAEPDTNHSWRFVRHSMLPQLVSDPVIECGVAAWEGCPSDGRDVILLVKQFLHHADFSQRALLVQPHAEAAKLRMCELGVKAANSLGDRAIHEFRKTALVVGAAPWNLVRAQAFLEKLCNDNESGHNPAGMRLRFLEEYKMQNIDLLSGQEMSSVDRKRARPPRVVKVKEAPKKKRCLRRPAAAAAAAAEEQDPEGTPHPT